MKKLVLYTVLLFFFLAKESIAQTTNNSGWQWQNPKPLGDAIQQVLFIDNQAGWIIPTNTTLLKTNDGGVKWKTIYTNIFFNNIFFLNKDEGWGIGRKHFVPELSNSIYHTTDGGLSWEIQLADTNAYYNICFTDKNNGWVKTYNPLSPILHTSNGGKTWDKQALLQFRLGDGGPQFWVMFIDSLKGWVVGGGFWAIKTIDGGNTWQRDSSLAGMKKIIAIDSLNFLALSGGELLAKSNNGGESWEYISYDTSITDRVATDIFALDTNRIFISTSIGFYGTSDGGNIWVKYSDEDMNAFSFISENEIWGGGTTNGLVASIVHSTDGGHHWVNLIETNNPLGFKTYNDVDFIDENTGWIIADLSILKTTDSGKNWFEQINPISGRLNDILMIDQNNGFIVGRGGAILKTTNGGINWVQKQGNTNYTLRKLTFINKSTGWIIGETTDDFSGIILKTTDEGNSWINQTPSNTPRLVGVSFIDSLMGWAISGGGSTNDYSEILHTTDGGNSWSTQAWGFQYDFYEVSFVDSVKGFILGHEYGNSSFVYRTLDGGSNWQSTPLSRAALYAVKFNNKDVGWIVGEFGNIYCTTDGGENWEEQFSYTHLDLYGIDFIDENNGWTVGWYGTILHTTNGGVTSVENKVTAIGVPENFTLFQNYPNPFNPSTTISYQLPKAGHVTLKIYDVLGNEVKTLVNEMKEMGRYTATFSADGGASSLASGMYVYQIKANDFMATKKMLLIK